MMASAHTPSWVLPIYGLGILFVIFIILVVLAVWWKDP